MSAAVPPASNNISEVVEKLRRLSQVDVQSGWRYCNADSAAVGSVGISNEQVVELNEKGHIAWPWGKQVVYLGQKFVIPDNLHGYPVVGLRLLLSLSWWAEDATIFVNGELVGQGDLFDCADRVLLSASVNPGDEFLVILRLVSPGHDNGALVRSICLYEAADSTCFDPGFVADELEILQKAIARNLGNKHSQDPATEILPSRPMYVKGEMLQSQIDLAVGLIDWSALPNRAKFDRSLSVLRHNLLGYLRAFCKELDNATAEAAEGTEGGSREKVFQVGENQNSTSIYIGENLNITSFSGELDNATAEAAEGTEGGSREKLSQVGENQNSTSIYIGESGDIAFLNQAMHSPANHQLPITNSQLSIPNFPSRPDSLETCHTSIYIGKIYLVGHAHLDLAWLWPVPETWEAAERTFESVLKLQSEFPDLIFCHSTPALYAWMEEHRPDLFAAIQKQVAAGCWEVVGGMWVEPDLNLISAESMVRQVFYGQRYAKEKFGELMRVAWLPDTFGFGWQLPQIWRQGGVDYFVTQKLRWNDSTQFPHGAFWWEGLDGTKIFSMMSGAIGESIESVKMASHAFDWQVKTGLQDTLWLPGVGDHGGGPTRDMLEVAKRWKLSPFFPRLEFVKAVDYLSLIESQFLPEVAEVDSISDVSQSPSRENLPIPEVVETLSDVASGNLLENSATSSKSQTSTHETPASLPISEVVETLSSVAPPNLLENSATLPDSLNSNLKTPASLPIPEVVKTLSDVASENSATLSESLNSNLKIPASLPIPEVVKTLSDVAPPNLLKNSTTLSESQTQQFEKSASLPISEVVKTLSDVISPNLLENAATLPESRTSIHETPESLLIAEVVETRADVISPNLLENSATLPDSLNSNLKTPESLPIAKVVETLSDVTPQNLLENSATLPGSRTSTQESPESLPIAKVVETLSDVTPQNLLENSATLPGSRTSTQESPASLPIAKVVETLSGVASEKLLENSTSSSESQTQQFEKSTSLPIPEVVEILSDVASEKLLENSTSSSESETNSAENKENLQLRKTTENLSGLAGDFSGKMSESEPKYLDFPTEIHQEKSQLKNSPSLPLSPSPLVPLSPSPNLPIWKDELYLEFHRGCYTTRADQKRQNRRCEDLLYQAELLSSIATICTGAVYPKVELESAWKQVLFNQFHDILPGSAIAQVYTDANLAFARVDRTCRHILLKSLEAIAAQISLPSPPQQDAQPIFVFNSLNWSRSEVVAVTLPDSPDWAWQIYDLSGQRLASQIVKGDRLPPQSQSTLLFSAQSVPAIGYQVFWLCHDPQTLNHSPANSATEKKTDLSKLTYGIAQKNTPCQETHFPAPEIILENELIRATVDAATGNLSSIWDKANNREVLNSVGGNQLQAFQDSGQYWDAWNIDPNYQKHPLPAPILKQISWVERGEVRQSLRVVMQIGKSEFRQDYIVEVGSPLLKIKTVVDWQETHVLVKTAFGLNVAADFATCEIPGGAIARTTKPQTPAEKAKWEVPIFRWTDISNDGFGVSLLNDCKYGCDIKPSQIRLTLLRSSTWPDEAADVGVSEFTCAVYPHAGNWQDAGTVRQGHELNTPLLVKVLSQLQDNRDRTLPPVGKFLDLSAENLVLMAFKQSEDDANVWILRCCESEGKQAVLALDGDLGLKILESVDLLERPASLSEKLPQSESFKIEPWKIASFAVVTNREGHEGRDGS